MSTYSSYLNVQCTDISVFQCVCWLIHHNNVPTSEQLCTSLHCVSLVLQNQQLSTVIGHRDHVTWICSITSSVHQLVSSCKCLITKTLLFKYIENFTTKKGKFLDKKSDIFHIFIPCHTIVAGYYGFTLDVRVSVRPSIHQSTVRPFFVSG